jgi:predicted AlkP superfamily phosphohydrolase/phosphomutase
MAETNPHLSIVVFTEIHHSAHYLWHTLSAEHPVYQPDLFRDLKSCEPTLKDNYREVDAQIGRLVEAAGPEATVLVFSLHGMRPTHGVPSFVQPLLCELGYSRLADWSSQTWAERAIATMGAVKRRTPSGLKRLYYKSLSPATTLSLARPTMLALYDWENTRVFALPADQHGWIHVNLKGREARGIVSPEEYEQTCNELEQILRGLAASDGRPIVREVFRTARTVKDALVQRLPDLVVHWEDAAFASPLKIKDSGFVSEPVGKKFTGRHARDGFCILREQSGLCGGETLRASEMHRLIKSSLRNGARVIS